MVTLVTGCRSGFGLLIAVTCARAGHTVYAGLRDLETAGDLRAAAGDLPVFPVQLDVTDPAQIDTVVATIEAEHGAVGTLVNNAGKALGGFLETLTGDELRRLFDVNVFAVHALTQRCLPAMRAAGQGVIVNVSSTSGILALPGLGAYASSKFALEGMTEAWRQELRPFGLHTYLVEPGPYKTDIWGRNRTVGAGGFQQDGPYAPYEANMDAIARKYEDRAGDAQDVADAILKLVDGPQTALRHVMGPAARLRFYGKRLLPFSWIEALIQRVLRG
jgi:NAD(P)-dependent dehydrogenase (short-subunit alcohol dehydrogenase family)